MYRTRLFQNAMLTHSRVKYIQSLADKKHRDETGVYVVEGPKMVGDYLREQPGLIRAIFALPGWMETHAASSLPDGTIEAVNEHQLGRISLLQTPNQVLAVVQQQKEVAEPSAISGIVLALDEIQDPGNMGTIIRTADWFGVKTIICSASCVDIYNPKVVQASMGSILRVRIVTENLISFLPRIPLPVYASSPEGMDLHHLARPDKGILIIGNEARGISDSLMSLAEHRISIPKWGGAESLNAAVATGILLSWLRT